MKLPDDLTTWRTQVRAIADGAQVGEGTSEVVSTKPLLVRSALPRFLRVGDAAELRAFVRNATAAAVDVTVTLRASGVAVSGAVAKSGRVPAATSVAFGWPARVESEGTVKVEFAADGGGELVDSLAVSLPAYIDVTPETTATSGVVTKEDQLEAVYLPPFADTKHGTLAVNVRSALVGSMADELAFLEPRLHESTPGVAARLIGTIGVRRAERSAGASAPRDGVIVRDVAGIEGRQRPDGGFPWCDDPLCGSDVTVTAWALFALGEARRDGVSVDASVVGRATSYLFAWVNAAPKPMDTSRVSLDGVVLDVDRKAFVLAALAAANGANVPAPAKPAEGPKVAAPSVTAAARALFEQYRVRLGSGGRAYLALALVDGGAPADDVQVRTLVDDLVASTLPSANGNHWEDGTASDKLGSFMTSASTTGLVALVLARLAPDHALLPQSVRWLVVARAAQRWQTDIDRAFGVLALTTYSARTGELGGDFAYRVLLDDKEVLAGLVKPSATPTTAAKKVPLTDVTPGKTSLLAFAREGGKSGRLYYTLDLRYVIPAKGVEAVNRGFAVSRSYSLLADPATLVTGARLGDVVRVTMTVIAPAERSYVVIEDLLPAGLEPVDVRLRTTDPALRAKLNGERVAASQRQAGGYAAPWLRWYYSPWQQVDVRDDRAVLMTDHLARGVYEYVYYARATTTGDFFVAPTHAEETYFPEVFGRTDSARFTVGP
ncbi:MAG: hypothetical protein E6G64_11325 [Actinobacteria bacterium]|nr:MAG: hypothetical protein E6G64_11325 [Actinomycetota bacterium]